MSRPSLPTDEFAIELLETTQLRRGDVVETREGICRLGPRFARGLGEASHPLREEVAPHGEWLAGRSHGRRNTPRP